MVLIVRGRAAVNPQNSAYGQVGGGNSVWKSGSHVSRAPGAYSRAPGGRSAIGSQLHWRRRAWRTERQPGEHTSPRKGSESASGQVVWGPRCQVATFNCSKSANCAPSRTKRGSTPCAIWMTSRCTSANQWILSVHECAAISPALEAMSSRIANWMSGRLRLCGHGQCTEEPRSLRWRRSSFTT